MHDHPGEKFPVRVSKETDKLMGEWNLIKRELSNLSFNADQKLEPYKTLINMCERLMISGESSQITSFKSLTKDLAKLTEKNKEF